MHNRTWSRIIGSIVLLVVFSAFVFPVNAQPMKVTSLVFCRDVVEREPVGQAASFDAAVGQVFCLMKLENLGAPATVTHVWSYGGTEVARINMEIGISAGWRAWSSKTILPENTGTWTVTVVDTQGATLGNGSFTVAPPAPAEPAPVAEPVAPVKPAEVKPVAPEAAKPAPAPAKPAEAKPTAPEAAKPAPAPAKPAEVKPTAPEAAKTAPAPAQPAEAKPTAPEVPEAAPVPVEPDTARTTAPN